MCFTTEQSDHAYPVHLGVGSERAVKFENAKMGWKKTNQYYHDIIHYGVYDFITLFNFYENLKLNSFRPLLIIGCYLSYQVVAVDLFVIFSSRNFKYSQVIFVEFWILCSTVISIIFIPWWDSSRLSRCLSSFQY